MPKLEALADGLTKRIKLCGKRERETDGFPGSAAFAFQDGGGMKKRGFEVRS